MIPLVACRWRTGHVDGRIACSSNRIVLVKKWTAEAICRKCPFPDHEPVVPADAKADGRIPLCVALGNHVNPPVAPDSIRSWHECDKGHGVVCPCRQCKTCPDYEPDR